MNARHDKIAHVCFRVVGGGEGELQQVLWTGDTAHDNWANKYEHKHRGPKRCISKIANLKIKMFLFTCVSGVFFGRFGGNLNQSEGGLVASIKR